MTVFMNSAKLFQFSGNSIIHYNLLMQYDMIYFFQQLSREGESSNGVPEQALSWGMVFMFNKIEIWLLNVAL